MNVVVIATHARKQITTLNIKSLQAQSIAPQIVVVCSLPEEAEYYGQFGVYTVLKDNVPLGLKWQAGIHKAHDLNADRVIITGSDDILSKGFIEKYSNGNDFTGFSSWYTFDQVKNEVFKTEYINHVKGFPLGAGRVYTKSFLDHIRWKVFNPEMNIRLDDQGFQQAKKHGRCVILNEPEVLLVKGNWKSMNPMERFYESKTLLMVKVSTSVINNFL